jgi:hypothetical protein
MILPLLTAMGKKAGNSIEHPSCNILVSETFVDWRSSFLTVSNAGNCFLQLEPVSNSTEGCGSNVWLIIGPREMAAEWRVRTR